MKAIKYLGVLSVICGVFLATGVVLAADADLVQPAEELVYSESIRIESTLTVEKAGYFPTIHIGSTEAGIGGVTYFNGTIVNASVNEEGEDVIPVTFGDDVRIDGAIWRGPTSGPSDDMPVKIMDDLYVDGVLFGGDSVVVDDNLEVTGDVTISGVLKGEETATETLTIDDDLEVTKQAQVAGLTAVQSLQIPLYEGTDPNVDLAAQCSDQTQRGQLILFKNTGVTPSNDSLWICAVNGGNKLGWYQVW